MYGSKKESLQRLKYINDKKKPEFKTKSLCVLQVWVTLLAGLLVNSLTSLNQYRHQNNKRNNFDWECASHTSSDTRRWGKWKFTGYKMSTCYLPLDICFRSIPTEKKSKTWTKRKKTAERGIAIALCVSKNKLVPWGISEEGEGTYSLRRYIDTCLKPVRGLWSSAKCQRQPIFIETKQSVGKQSKSFLWQWSLGVYFREKLAQSVVRYE